MIDELEMRQHSAHNVGGIDGSVELGYAPREFALHAHRGRPPKETLRKKRLTHQSTNTCSSVGR